MTRRAVMHVVGPLCLAGFVAALVERDAIRAAIALVGVSCALFFVLTDDE